MKAGDVQKYLKANISRVRARLGVPHWDIGTATEPIDGSIATCEARPEYEQATLTFDPGKIRGAAHLEELLLHELCHVVHSPTEDYFRVVRALHDPEKTPQGRMLAELERQVAERLVVNLIRMYRCLTEESSRAQPE